VHPLLTGAAAAWGSPWVASLLPLLFITSGTNSEVLGRRRNEVEDVSRVILSPLTEPFPLAVFKGKVLFAYVGDDVRGKEK